MQKFFKYAIVLPMLWACSAPASSEAQNSYGSGTDTMAKKEQMIEVAGWPVVIKNYLTAPDADGLVRLDYARLQNSPDRAILEAYIADLQAQNPDELSPDAAVSYWANLYLSLIHI